MSRSEKLTSKVAAVSAKLAGGGVTNYAAAEKFDINKFEASVLDGLREAYKATGAKGQSFDDFLAIMATEESNAIGAANEQDLAHPLSNYFISSSHNTYLTGHQLYGKANVDGYKNVLLRGCRSVEIDVWDGEPPSSSESSSDEEQSPPVSTSNRPTKWTASERVEPVVLHGYTATKEVTFRRVCETIRDNAFKTSNLPVVVSLEVHTCHEQQELMVEIMEETFKGLLLDADQADDQKLPSPAELAGKILIKVKYSPPNAPQNEDAASLGKATSQSSAKSDDEESKAEGKPSKIIAALSKLGVYMRSYSFKSFTQPEAAVPTHIFSLSEGALSEAHKTDPQALFDHNKKYLMRAYPRGIRISSSNLDPSPFWRAGVQMVALNWQRIDSGLMLNEAMFANTGGWVLKPPSHRTSASYAGEPTGYGSSFSVTFVAGQDLPLPEGTEARELKPFVKCELHVEIPNEWEKLTNGKEKSGDEFKEKTKPVKGVHPDFKGQTIEFKQLPSLTPELSFVRFKIMHDRLVKDPLIAWNCIRLDRLKPGYRFVHLFDAKGLQTKGIILVNFNFNWQLRQEAGAQQNLPVR